jgi:hypothetical protein
MIPCHLFYFPKEDWVPEGTPSCMLPVVNEPFLYRVLQQVHSWGVKSVTFWVNKHELTFQEVVSKQSRWGLELHLEVVSDQETAINQIDSRAGSRLIGCCDRLIELSSLELLNIYHSDKRVLWKKHNGFPSGWYFESSEEIRHYFTAKKTNTLSVETPNDFLQSQAEILKGQWFNLTIGGKRLDNDVYQHRGVSVSSEAEILDKSVLGPHCKIHAHSKIGPLSVIGPESIISSNTDISNSCVLPGVIIGPGLEIKDAIVGPCWIYNIDLNEIVVLPKECSSSVRPDFNSRLNFSRWLARLSWVFLCPLVLIIDTIHWLMYGCVMENCHAYCKSDGSHVVLYRLYSPFNSFQRFLQRSRLDLIPLLLNIANDDLSWVGLRPRTRIEYDSMEPESKRLYARIGPGLFYCCDNDKSEKSLDRWYFINKSLKTNLQIVWKSLWKKS